MKGFPTNENIGSIAIREISFANNYIVVIPVENRGVVKVYLGYNGSMGYIDDTLYIDGKLITTVRNGTGTPLTYEYTTNQLTIKTSIIWSFGYLITTRIFY